MKYNIKDIGSEGLIINRHLDDREIRGLLAEAGIEILAPPAHVQLDLTIRQADPGILVSGSLEGRFSVQCSRCLGPAPIHFFEPALRLTFLPTGSAPEAEDLDYQDVDTYTHDGKELDLWPVIHEFLVLAIPMAPLCQADCKGICIACGAELNIKDCSCIKDPIPSKSWAVALGQLRKTMDKKE